MLHKNYEVFGDTHSTVGSHSELRGWIGEREEETELVYLNARYYDPEIGRFVSSDPLASMGQGLNRYTYSLNNPVSFLDSSGLAPQDDPCAGMTPEQCEDHLNENSEQYRCEEGLDCPTPRGDGEDWVRQTNETEESIWKWVETGHNKYPEVDCSVTPCHDPVARDKPSEQEGEGTGETTTPGCTCANGCKTNCPGNRSGGGAGADAAQAPSAAEKSNEQEGYSRTARGFEIAGGFFAARTGFRLLLGGLGAISAGAATGQPELILTGAGVGALGLVGVGVGFDLMQGNGLDVTQRFVAFLMGKGEDEGGN